MSEQPGWLLRGTKARLVYLVTRDADGIRAMAAQAALVAFES
jgi:hypothetical protein